MKRRIFVGAGAAALADAPGWAQSKIGGDVRFYCGFAPGGTADLLCRILADAVTPEVGQKVIVDTKTGASGFIANETVANAAPDGRTIGLAAMAAMCVAPVMPGQKLPINVDTDLAPIANIAGVYNMLVFGKHVPFRTVPELIEHAKKNPGKLSYASAGAGNQTQLVAELLKAKAGIEVVHVPYKSGAEMVTAVLGEQVQLTFPDISILIPLIRDHKVKALAVTSARRHPQLPDVPTLLESGIPDFAITFWSGVVAPAGTPVAIVTKLNAAMDKGLRSQEIQDKLAAIGAQTTPGSPQDFASFIASETVKWREIAKTANVSLD